MSSLRSVRNRDVVETFLGVEFARRKSITATFQEIELRSLKYGENLGKSTEYVLYVYHIASSLSDGRSSDVNTGIRWQDLELALIM